MTGLLLAVGVLIGSLAFGSFRTKVLTTKLLMGALGRDSALRSSLFYVLSATIALMIIVRVFSGLPAHILGMVHLLIGVVLGVHFRRALQLVQLSKLSSMEYHSAVKKVITAVSHVIRARGSANESSMTLEVRNNGVVSVTLDGRSYLVYTEQGFITSNRFSQVTFHDLLAGTLKEEAILLNSIADAVRG